MSELILRIHLVGCTSPESLSRNVIQRLVCEALKISDCSVEVDVCTLRVKVFDAGSAEMLALQNRVLSGETDAALSRALSHLARHEISTRCERGNFARAFAEARRRGELTLTAHQAQVLSSCETKARIHLRAPAGAGKTLWSLFLILNTLRKEESNGLVVLVARNLALSAWAARWLVRREEAQAGSKIEYLLGRFRVLNLRNKYTLQKVCIKKDHLAFEENEKESLEKIALIVVDEAHHVYACPEYRSRLAAIEAKRWLLLSDESQAQGDDALHYPSEEEWTQVRLTQVARCSKRLVAGAMAFQTGGKSKLDTENCTGYDGPPLKSYVFVDNTIEAYRLRLCEALQHADEVLLPGLGLGSRLLICVPDAAFLESHKEIVTQALKTRGLRPVSALEAMCQLDETNDYVVFDSIDELDGLESLLVICLGLDSACEDKGFGSNACRSALYRGLTRGQLSAIVVNHKVAGGWLDFLSKIRLLEADHLDSKVEAKRLRPEAADERVRSDTVKQLLQAAATKRGLSLTPAVLRVLTSASIEEKKDVDNASISSQLDMWSHEVALVYDRLRQLSFQSYDDNDENDICTEVALQLRRVPGLRLETVLRERIEEVERRRALAGVQRALNAIEPQTEAERIILGDEKFRTLLAKRGLVSKANAGDCQESLLGPALKAVAETYDSLRQRILEEEDGKAEWALEAARRVAEGSTPEDAFSMTMKKYRKQANHKAAADAVRTILLQEKQDSVSQMEDLLVMAVLREAHRRAENQDYFARLRRRALRDGVLVNKTEQDWCRLARHVFNAWHKARQQALELAGPQIEDIECLLEDLIADENMVIEPYTAAKRATACWRSTLRKKREMKAAAGSSVEAEAQRLRLSLNARVISELVDRVLREKPSLDLIPETAVLVLKNWREAIERQKLEQAVWDPSANEQCEVAADGYTPYSGLNDESALNYDVLLKILRILGLSDGCTTAAAVCRRWRAAANDPSWRPPLLVFAWGKRGCSGLKADSQAPQLFTWALRHAVVSIVCANYATLALIDDGDVFHWGRSWNSSNNVYVREPAKINDLRDVVAISCTPRGYHHGRTYIKGFSACAVTSSGALYTWGDNYDGHLFHQDERCVDRPKRIILSDLVTDSIGRRIYRVIHAACGLRFIALNIEDVTSPFEGISSAKRFVLVHGRYHSEALQTTRVLALDDRKLRQLVAGAFHCVALTTTGQLYTWGDCEGFDISNGNLLGTGRPIRQALGLRPIPQFDASLVDIADGDPIAHVAASTYSTVALSVDGRAFAWGDCDGNALGDDFSADEGDDDHSDDGHPADVRFNARAHPGDTPQLITGLRGIPAVRADVSYTNGAVTTLNGRVFLWGGQSWEGGIAGDRSDNRPTELRWTGFPPGYKASNISLGHEHGFLLLSSQI